MVVNSKNKWVSRLFKGSGLLVLLPYVVASTLLTTLACWSVAAASEKDIVFYNWEDFMPQIVLDDFYAQTGHRVRQVYFDSEMEAREIILSERGKGMDLVLSSRYELQVLLEQEGIFAKVPYDELPNLQYIDPIWQKNTANINHISVPWVWGTSGILYRSDLVELENVTWMDLMSPPLSSKGKVMMSPSMRDIMAAALLASNSSINTSNEEAILQAGLLLQTQKNDVLGYQFLLSEIVSGEIHLAQSYSSDAAEFLALNENIAYVIPDGKAPVWLNNLAVFESSQHKEIAFAFINFVNDPARAAFIAEYLATSSANKAAARYFSEEYVNKTSLNVPLGLLEANEMFEVLAPKTISRYNAIYYNIVRPEL